LNKNDLFERKVAHSDINYYFPDYIGASGDAPAGRSYFKERFLRLARNTNYPEDRPIYVHTTTATDTTMIRVAMSAIEEYVFPPSAS
jgi:guanine nucleotide-binding protein subunit alpha